MMDASENRSGIEPEVFALTDEQILGMEPEEVTGDEGGKSRSLATAAKGAASARDDNRVGARDDKNAEAREAGSGAQAGVRVPLEPPKWLAERMKDPWVGDEARELWEGAQRAQQEAAAYREAIATPEDARALKELYPGGVSEAKSAAERARQLEEIDGAYFGAAGKPAEELSAGRAALAQRLYAQDPAAFREMVAAGVNLLGGVAGGDGDRSRSLATAAKGAAFTRDDNRPTGGDGNRAGGRDENSSGSGGAGVAVPPETAQAYAAFEKTANAELERSVGGEIARRMEQALPNLKQMSAPGQGRAGHADQGARPLQERLGTAVREEIDVALKSDGQLGEQVARVLAGRRFDEATRAQVVRLIGARAQQLVPGAVRKVVGEWTQATLTARRSGGARDGTPSSSIDLAPANGGGGGVAQGAGNTKEGRRVAKNENSSRPAARVDYRKLSDEQILDL